MRCNALNPDVGRRGGDADLFTQYAAQGRRNGTTRVYVTLISDVDRLGQCPAAMLVGVDAAPEPGLRGPTNFHGLLHAAVLQDLDKTLAHLRRGLRWAAKAWKHGLGI